MSGGLVVGWLDTNVFGETGDAAKAYCWTAPVLDTHGNGKRDTQSGQVADFQKRRKNAGPLYRSVVTDGDRPVALIGSAWAPGLGSLRVDGSLLCGQAG
jgi:hypothetical protein